MTMPGLELELTQRMRLAPAAVAVLSVLSLPQGDLDELIAARVATNPLLERGAPRRCRWCSAPAYGGRCGACGPGPVPATGSDRAWIETLRTDARAAVPTRLGGAVNAVVDHLDPRGLLDAGVDEIAEAAGRSPAEIAVALAAVREAGPPGVATRDARDCLAAQARWHAAHGGPGILLDLVEHLDRVAEGAHEEIADALAVPVAAVEAAVTYLRTRLRPYPVFEGRATEPTAPPDVIVRSDPASPGGMQVVVLGCADLGLRLDEQLASLPLETADAADRGWVAAHRAEAAALLTTLDRRAASIQRVAATAVLAQREYVLSGPAHHRPLTRTAVAGVLGVAVSTVSRAVAGKTVRLPDAGVVPLASFFAPAVPTKALLRELLESGSPASDAVLAAELARRGHPVARRTVNKSRRQIQGPRSG